MSDQTTRDKVRLYTGDTDSDRPLLLDTELDILIDDRAGNAYLAAADACDAIAAKFARDPSWSADGQSVNVGERVKHYQDLGAKYRMRGAGGLTVVPITRVDGYSDDLSTRDGAGQTSNRGRVLRGYTDPDLPV